MNAIDERDEGNDGNEGSVDRFVRVVAGLALLALCIVGPTSVWGLLGVVPLVTGIAGECPFYRVLGISTRLHANGANGTNGGETP
jgi:hypothetical protein